jgi:hypothetical protein
VPAGGSRLAPLLIPAALAIVVTALLARPAPAFAAGCADRVIADWRDGRLDGTYSRACLRAALRSLPEDLRIYGSAEEDITLALNAETPSARRRLAAATRTTPPKVTSRSRPTSTRPQAGETASASSVAATEEAAFSTRAVIVAAVMGAVAIAVAASLWRARRRPSH